MRVRQRIGGVYREKREMGVVGKECVDFDWKTLEER